MLKIAIVICSSFYLFASQEPTEVSEGGFPLRRTPAMYPGVDACRLNGTLSERLLVMVNGSFLDDVDISENKTIELIRSNPGESNPHYGPYDAYLIALACRQGMKDVVQAIVESNPDSLNCLSAGFTPLDEVIEFSQPEVAEYLRSVGAVCTLLKPLRTHKPKATTYLTH
jgi:hypothetical protein